jgi:hypothetical protein
MGQRLPISQERERLINLKFNELRNQSAADLQKKLRKKVEEFGGDILGSGIAQGEIRNIRISEIIKLANELVKIDIGTYGHPPSEMDIDAIVDRVKVFVEAQMKEIYRDAVTETGVDCKQEFEVNRDGIISNIKIKLLIVLYEAQLNVQKDKNIDRQMKIGKNTPITYEACWVNIQKDFNISKKEFGGKINFIKDKFKREIIFRDVEQCFILLKMDFHKPALILAGGVIEELLRLYLVHNDIIKKGEKKIFNDYINLCKEHCLLKFSVQGLTDAIRNFRNLVHLELEKTKKDSITKSDAATAVASIFSIANGFSKKNAEN